MHITVRKRIVLTASVDIDTYEYGMDDTQVEAYIEELEDLGMIDWGEGKTKLEWEALM